MDSTEPPAGANAVEAAKRYNQVSPHSLFSGPSQEEPQVPTLDLTLYCRPLRLLLPPSTMRRCFKVTSVRQLSASLARSTFCADTADQRVYHTDRTTPFPLYRWGSTVAVFLLFTLRIVWVQAYYIVAYALG